jgi:hypothetical protein
MNKQKSSSYKIVPRNVRSYQIDRFGLKNNYKIGAMKSSNIHNILEISWHIQQGRAHLTSYVGVRDLEKNTFY